MQELAGLFVRVLKMCERAGLVKLGHVAIDARELRANASKHKALPAEQQAGMSYERMCEKDEQLAAEVEQLLRAAAEDGRGGRRWRLARVCVETSCRRNWPGGRVGL